VAGIFLLSSGYWLYTHRQTTHSTQYGKTASLTLPDGSRVVLNGNSRLRYAANWDNQRTREVWLEGEGFFDITKQTSQDPLHKDYAHFVVHTADLDVQVLGTRFNVSERKAKTQVVLSSGKVKLGINARPHSSPLLMEPGESVEFIHRDEQVVRRKVDPNAYSSWQNSELVFKNTPLFEVADIIESTYGMAMVFQNISQRNRRLTGNIRTDDIDKILKALSRSLNLEFVQVNKQIMVRELSSDSENN
jgi:ferric-dicitrate binding protein FerR (iron transport regulator)